MLYLILKQKFEVPSSSSEEADQAKRENEAFVKRLTLLQDIAVKKLQLDTVVKVLERLIKNEKFHCKILISLILLLLKHHSKDQKGTDSLFKESALGLIKKLLKKRVWDLLGKSRGEDWACVKRGLMIYFGNKGNWSKELYRVWKEYVADRVKDEMLKESSEVYQFVQSYKK